MCGGSGVVPIGHLLPGDEHRNQSTAIVQRLHSLSDDGTKRCGDVIGPHRVPLGGGRRQQIADPDFPVARIDLTADLPDQCDRLASGDSSVSPQLAGVACERSVSAKEKLN
jgi:hypothetical protein